MLPKRLKETRTNKKLTQQDLAKKIGVTAKTISNYETGAVTPSVDTLIKIADCLETTTDFLLGRTVEYGIITKGLSSEVVNAINNLIDTIRYQKK